METTFAVNEDGTFTELLDGEIIGTGDARDIESLRDSGELLPELETAWLARFGTDYESFNIAFAAATEPICQKRRDDLASIRAHRQKMSAGLAPCSDADSAASFAAEDAIEAEFSAAMAPYSAMEDAFAARVLGPSLQNRYGSIFAR